MRKRISEEIMKIEETYRVKILYACESGSRAWGVPSKDSDYDVRFIYIHSKDWYLSIDQKRDVIELPINDLLDMNGWELTKALRLFRKSNPSLLEWLNSSIVYYQAYSTIEKMKNLSSQVFVPTASMYHYLNMGKRNFHNFMEKDYVKIKKYFYVLRPVLACKWIETYNTFPPIEFAVLLEQMIQEDEIKTTINQLLERKQHGDESDQELRNDMLYHYLKKEMAHLTDFAHTLNSKVVDPTDKLNHLFRETLDEVWG
ncbi:MULTISPECIES: nucleotidyltransferase domain-containing protein [Heyndrickxia]|uniref:nucleotidyltransferase domain-containing protein n=1 Tax=Heyndrickxia TaxID=2837504 RepID=UPI001B2A7DE9|nr:nucleotidyltransferase domain-containing protein [Heyndrickxia oleronia]GIN37282.1 hypothetical protein J19TS1_02310 [Heyndrickxia oleronia]